MYSSKLVIVHVLWLQHSTHIQHIMIVNVSFLLSFICCFCCCYSCCWCYFKWCYFKCYLFWTFSLSLCLFQKNCDTSIDSLTKVRYYIKLTNRQCSWNTTSFQLIINAIKCYHKFRPNLFFAVGTKIKRLKQREKKWKREKNGYTARALALSISSYHTSKIKTATTVKIRSPYTEK